MLDLIAKVKGYKVGDEITFEMTSGTMRTGVIKYFCKKAGMVAVTVPERIKPVRVDISGTTPRSSE